MIDDLPTTVVTLHHPFYPKILKEIHNPPSTFFAYGDVSILNAFSWVGIVGTRDCTNYGREATRHLVTGLVTQGLGIVSGLAIGIDTESHQAALCAHGKTVAVLGSGLKYIYPSRNQDLVYEIVKSGGVVLSEYSHSENVARYNFPKRNRIISGLSRGVVVVEAAQKSGALITAKYALEQNRNVYAVPGSIFWEKSVGPHFLISQGAKPVTHPNDILSDLNYPCIEKENSQVTKDEKQILDFCSTQKARLDDLVFHTGFSTEKVMELVTIMELNGKIKATDGGIYESITGWSK
ncbi:MAG: DNA protecting protein DprA [Deltaproteobacteria bacterium RIFCSPLOWO2_12_FULL_40_28]|nr:MAG: DNA protecting protein DprA [Deltaproteobacteria bacterium RIFCSPHIGHO2_02_FULL_40_28]OGQ20967.1 MAG: DNA protecting protein DprA [Deltaproteobacteria bacterium RIFCSPHIGHO2_12_FULL_40_32]OGQ39368.1 MAG: DNA protecting protein DprA [Deltaproteobacteria bacterium RIFCSPLOWO2_02_FULL_40_36]OGQ54649.1 MAG: DNA protecting protein DprA [Deltaproteobacteria bacterium RIFCSPLOWO2_12_FULL_40_28]